MTWTTPPPRRPVVHNLIDQVVQAGLAGGADVHTRALAHRLQPLQDLDHQRGGGTAQVPGGLLSQGQLAEGLPLPHGPGHPSGAAGGPLAPFFPTQGGYAMIDKIRGDGDVVADV